MDMSIMAVDIEGTLANPLVVAMLFLYSILLGVAAYLLAIRILSNKRLQIPTLLAAVLVATGTVANGTVVRSLIASVIKVTSTFPGYVGVGFFGHHPPWIAPVVVVLGAISGIVRQRTRDAAVA